MAGFAFGRAEEPRDEAAHNLPGEATPAPGPSPADDEVRGALKLVAMREHSLRSLSELASSMSASPDLFHLSDVVLFSLMGQFGTPRVAFWLSSEASPSIPVLMRSHGVNRQVAREIALVAGPRLLQLPADAPGPFSVSDLGVTCGDEAASLAGRAGLTLFARVTGREASQGIVALGPRINGKPYGPLEAQALTAALNMLSVAIQNHTLYARLAENNRLLRQAIGELKDLDRLKSDILSNVSHELRTPLSVIMGYLECLRLNPQATEDMMRKAMAEAVKLEKIVENLLTYSAATQNRLVMNLEIGDPARCLEAWCRERLPGISERLREFTWILDSGLPAVRFDEKRLLQVVDALLDNAVKFTSAGGRVQLRAFATGSSKRSIAVALTDDGPGVTEEQVPELFAPFRQADSSSTRSVGGMGLGLAFSRELVQAMGGTLTVTAAPGQGSTFTVLLPAA